MTLHIFNPGHDIALASNRPRQTMPRAARELRADLGWLPLLWSGEGDCILVEDVDFAREASRRFLSDWQQCGARLPHAVRGNSVRFVTREQLVGIPFSEVSPWGWDACLVQELIDSGLSAHLMPSMEYVQGELRELSHRRNTIPLLQSIRQGIEHQTCGEAMWLHTVEQCRDYLRSEVVFKAPWSSSGRGVRFSKGQMTASLEGWIVNTIREQGGIMAEPYYNKVLDFALEFEVHPSSRTHPLPHAPSHTRAFETTRYLGLSLFQNTGSAYSGNIIANEAEKRRMLCAYIEEALLDEIISRLTVALTSLLDGRYHGPLGVDMMIVSPQTPPLEGAGEVFLVHPCVEINLRRTMGHVALALTPATGTPQIMCIEHHGHYQLCFST